MDTVNISAKIKNLKFSAIINCPITLSDINVRIDHINEHGLTYVIDHKKHPNRNFQIIKKEKLCFTFFANSSNIGLTGIKSEEALQEAVKILPTLLIKNIEILKIRLDNITASGSLNHPIIVKNFIEKAKGKESEVVGNIYKRKLIVGSRGEYTRKGKSVPFIKYNPSIFPGAYILTDFGTIGIFYSGKYTLIGCPSREDCEKLEKYVFEFANKSEQVKNEL